MRGTRQRPIALGSIVTGLLALLLPTSAAHAQGLDSFDGIAQIVSDFEAGNRPDVINAACVTSPAGEPLTCAQPNPDTIVGSGWKIDQICFAILEAGQFSIAMRQRGLIGDGDGDGNPNAGSINFDIPGIGVDEFYTADLHNSFAFPPPNPDLRLRILQATTGEFTPSDFPGLAPSSGNLCLIDNGGAPFPTVGPAGLGCVNATVLGTYSAGTTGALIEAVLPPDPLGKSVSTDVIFQIDDVAALPATRSLNTNRFRIVSASGSGEPTETCQEDFEILNSISSSVAMVKSASVLCQNGNYQVSSRYTISNDGGDELSGIVLWDSVSTDPAGRLDGPPICRVDPPGGIVVSADGPNGSFHAELSAVLAASDPDTGAIDSVVVDCDWSAVPAEQANPLVLDNDATVTASGDREVSDTSSFSASDDNQGCITGGMMKEHEGVGFDNLVALEKTLPLNGGFQFGSGVDPSGLFDVDADEDFIALGALPIPNRPGVFVTIPRNPGGAGVPPSSGQAARFSWTMLVSKSGVDFITGIDLACSLCAENAWRTDGSPVQTFARPPLKDAVAVTNGVINKPLRVRVYQICGPLHFEPCKIALDAKSIPGLEPLPLDLWYGGLVFLGCKPTSLLIDPSNGPGIRQNDLIEVQIDVPESEAARLFADPTSCQMSYLRTKPDFEF